MKLLACGDSWCWGAELVDPVIDPEPIMNLPGGGFERQSVPENIKYRLEHRYINQFAKLANIDNIEDLSLPSQSNDAIFRKLVAYLATNGYLTGENTEELFVSIGWTSPERTEHYYKEQFGDTNYAPYGPWSLDQDFTGQLGDVEGKKLHEFYNLFFDLFGDAKGFVTKYIHTVFLTQMLLKSFNIKYVMHQAFYHHHEQMLREWNDEVYRDKNLVMTDELSTLWNLIDDNNFINKDSTAHKVMIEKGNLEDSFIVYHPSALGHKIWGQYMFDFCKERNII
jgi:hypothetical protein